MNEGLYSDVVSIGILRGYPMKTVTRLSIFIVIRKLNVH